MNLLPSFGKHFIFDDEKNKWVLLNDDIPSVKIISESDEFNIFKTESMKNFIEYKWREIGFGHHLWGAIIHVIFLVFIAVYTNTVYINADFQAYEKEYTKEGFNFKKNENWMALVFVVMMIYPTVYSFIQAKHQGFIDYLTDMDNF